MCACVCAFVCECVDETSGGGGRNLGQCIVSGSGGVGMTGSTTRLLTWDTAQRAIHCLGLIHTDTVEGRREEGGGVPKHTMFCCVHGRLNTQQTESRILHHLQINKNRNKHCVAFQCFEEHRSIKIMKNHQGVYSNWRTGKLDHLKTLQAYQVKINHVFLSSS